MSKFLLTVLLVCHLGLEISPLKPQPRLAHHAMLYLCLTAQVPLPPGRSREWNRGQPSVWELRLHEKEIFQREFCVGVLFPYAGWLEGASSFIVCWFVCLFLVNDYSQNSPQTFILHFHHQPHFLSFNLSSYSYILDKATEVWVE